MVEEIAAMLVAKGFNAPLAMPPSVETRQQYLIRVETTKGWKYLRLKRETPSPLEAAASWAGQFEAAPWP